MEINTHKEGRRIVKNEAQRVPQLSSKESLCGIEYSHLMLKPEAIASFGVSPDLKLVIISMLMNAFSALGLDVICDIEGYLPLEVINEIYKKEIAMGIIPAWELERFSTSRTRHFILKGIGAIEKTHIIKGRFSCTPGACYFAPGVDRTPLLYVFRDEGCSDGIGGWGHGCGVRGFLAKENLVQPDPDETEYTVYNWVHSPDPGQNFAVEAIINSINNRTII